MSYPKSTEIRHLFRASDNIAVQHATFPVLVFITLVVLYPRVLEILILVKFVLDEQ